MREILFRGFHPCKDSKDKIFYNDKWVNGEWVSGYYISKSNHACFANELKNAHYILRDECLDFNLGGIVDYEVIPETIGQYTGIDDECGTKIFEGGIIQTEYANARINEFIEVVVFKDGKFMSEHKMPNGGIAWSHLVSETKHILYPPEVYMKSCAVIGNIHSNPELLEVGQ